MPFRVLLVEDDPDVACTIRLSFPTDRHVSANAEDLASARALLAHGPRPDLVTLDVGLPDGDGLTLCRAVKAQHPTLSVVVITASGLARARREAIVAGADAFVEKPFDSDDPHATVERLLEATASRPPAA
jgi:DNA-binding response OmpR family regulator